MAYLGFHHIESIHASIRALYGKLGNAKIMTFNHDFKNPELMVKFRQDSAYVQQLARVIAEHYQLLVRTISVSFKDLQDKAAKINPSVSSDFAIDINPKAIEDSNELLAVLAHEVTHIFLYRIGLSLEDTEQNEILTDTTATYLGLGNIILNAYSLRHKEIDKKTTICTTRFFGYLEPIEYGYIIAKRAKKFNCDPAPFLNSEAHTAFYTGLGVLESEYRFPPLQGSSAFAKLRYLWHRRCATKKGCNSLAFHKDYGHSLGYAFENREGVHVIFQCRSCLQLLRIPAFRDLISVHCPRCESTYQCKP